jgi:hypothetical protein
MSAEIQEFQWCCSEKLFSLQKRKKERGTETETETETGKAYEQINLKERGWIWFTRNKKQHDQAKVGVSRLDICDKTAGETLSDQEVIQGFERGFILNVKVTHLK